MENKICILGDSVAKGVLFDDVRNRYCIAKENLGTQLAQVFGCSVTNLTKFGSTVTDGLARFVTTLWSKPEGHIGTKPFECMPDFSTGAISAV